MIKMILMTFQFLRKIIQIWLHDMFDIMESIGHGLLESGTRSFKTKRKFATSEGAPRTDEGNFMLVFWKNFNLIVSREVVHKGKNFTTGTIINYLVDEGGWIVVLGTISI